MIKKYFPKWLAIIILIVVILLTFGLLVFHLDFITLYIITERTFDFIIIGYIISTIIQIFILYWVYKKLYKYIKNYNLSK